MKRALIVLASIVFATSLAACSAKQVKSEGNNLTSVANLDRGSVDYSDYDVAQVAKMKTTSTVPSDIESLPIGTQFMCYPQQEFDFIARGQFSSIDFVDVPIHISSMTAVLTNKNSFEEFSINPTVGMATQGTFIFQPYEVTITVSGYIDPTYNMKRIQPIIISSTESDPWAYANYLPSIVIDENGNFTVVEKKFWTSPASIWFSGAYLSTSEY